VEQDIGGVCGRKGSEWQRRDVENWEELVCWELLLSVTIKSKYLLGRIFTADQL
jgi:hypothetical protein